MNMNPTITCSWLFGQTELHSKMYVYNVIVKRKDLLRRWKSVSNYKGVKISQFNTQMCIIKSSELCVDHPWDGKLSIPISELTTNPEFPLNLLLGLGPQCWCWVQSSFSVLGCNLIQPCLSRCTSPIMRFLNTKISYFYYTFQSARHKIDILEGAWK